MTEMIRTHCPSLGLLQLTGDKATVFLQGQTTCNIDSLTAIGGLRGACCNNKGRVLAMFTVIQMVDGIGLIMPTDIIPLLITHLKKYAMFDRVVLTDLSESTDITILQNVDATELAEKNVQAVVVDDMAYVINQLEACETITETMDEHHFWQQQLKAKHPRLHPETVATFTAHQLNLPELGYVSFKKGCYTGQEIVARTEYLGKSKKSLHVQMLADEQLGAVGEKIEIEGQSAQIIDVVSELENENSAVLILY